MTCLRELSLTTPVNLQFADRRDFQEFEGFDTLAVLRQDSNSLTGQSGARKPVVSELFTCLAEAAVRARGALLRLYQLGHPVHAGRHRAPPVARIGGHTSSPARISRAERNVTCTR